MRIHEVQTTDGVIRRITAPESATQEDIMAFVDSTYPPIKAAPEYEQQGIAGIPSQQAAQQTPPEESGIFRRYIGDNLLSLGQGVIGLGEAAVGLADIPTFGYAGKGVEAASDAIFGGDLEDASQYLQSLKTPEQLAQEQEVADAEGTGLEKFGNTIGALITNPGALANTIFNTLPQMAGGAGIARAGLAIAKKRGRKITGKDYLTAASAGEGVVAVGAQAESIRKQTEDGLLTPTQAILATGSGVFTGILGRVGGIAAQKLGVVDIDAALAGQAISEAGQRKVQSSILQAVKAGIGESVFEELPQSMQEQVISNIALDRDPMEGVAEAAAEGVVAGFALAGGITGGRQFLENRNIKNEEQNKKIRDRIKETKKAKETTDKPKKSEEGSDGVVGEQQKQARAEIEARRAAKRAEEERNKGGDVAGVVPGAVVPPATTGANAAPAIFNISDFDSGRVVSDEEINELGYVGKTQRKLQNLDYEKPQAIQEAITILKNTSKAGNKNLNRPLIQEKINALEKLQAARQEQKALDAKAKKEEESKDVGGDVAGTTTAAPVVDTTAAPVVDTTAAPVVDTTAAPDVDPNALNQQAADEFGFYPEAQDNADDQGYEGPVGFTPQVKSPAPDKKVFTQETLDSLGYSKTGTVYKELAGLTFGTGGLETAIEKLETTLTRKSKTKAGQNIAALLPKLKGLRATKNVKKDLKEATDLFSQDQLDDLRLMGATEAEFKQLKSTKPNDVAAAKAKLIQIVEDSTRNPTTKAAYRKQINRLEALTPTRFPIKPQAGLGSEGVGAFATDAALEEGIGKGPIINRNGQDIYISTTEYATALENRDTNYETVSAKTLKPINLAATDSKIKNSLKGNSKNPITGTSVKVGDRIQLARINPDPLRRKRKAYTAELYEGVVVEDTFIDPETKEEASQLFLKVDNSSVNKKVALNDTQIVNPDIKDKKRIKEVAAGMQKKNKSASADRSKDYYAQQKAMTESIELTETPFENLDYLENRKQGTLKERVSKAKKALNEAVTKKFGAKIPETVGEVLSGFTGKLINTKLNASQKILTKILQDIPNIKNVKIVLDSSGAIPGDAAGQYNVETNTITIESLADVETLFHEMIHAATARGIRNLKPEGKTYKQLAALFTEAREAAELAGIAEYADMTSIDEFVTMAFTDANYQKFLSEVKTEAKITKGRAAKLEGDTLWRSFVNAVKAVVVKFKEGISGSVLNNVIALQSDLFIGPDDIQQKQYKGEVLYNKKNNVKEIPTKDERAVDKELSEKAGFIDKVVTNIFSFDAGLNRAIIRVMKATGQTTEAMEAAMFKMMASQGLHATNLAQLYAAYGDMKYDEGIMDFKVDNTLDQSSMAKIKEQVNQYAVENDMSTEEYGKIAQRYFEAVRLNEVKKGFNADLIQEAEEKGLEGGELDAALSKLKFIHLTDAEINEALESENKYSGLKEIADTWNEVRIKTINLLVDNGVMDRNTAEEYIDAIGYVPFYRMENGEAIPLLDITSGLSQIGNLNNKKFKGSEKEVANIFENMDRWVQHSARASIINRLKTNKIDTSMEYAEGVLVKQVDSEEGTKGNVVKITRNIPAPTTEDPNATEFVTESYEFSDPIFAAAFGTTFALAIGPIQGFFRGAASFLRQNIVLYPLFSLSQLPQDSISAMLSSGVKNPFMIPVRVVKEFALTLMNMSTVREEAKKYGIVGDRSWTQAPDRGVLSQKTYQERDTSKLMGKIAENLDKNTITGPLIRGLEKIAMASDNAVRQAVFEQTMRETATDKSSLEKIFETGDTGLAVTRAFEVINFRRKGSSELINTLSQVVPFFSAGLQALSVQGRVLTGGGIAPGQRALQVRQTITTATMMTGVYLAYAAAMSGDEDYEKLDPKEKDNKLILPGGWSIPLRPDLFTYLVKVVPENILRDLRGDQDGEKTFQAIKKGLMNSVSMSAIPQAVRPLIDVYVTNESGSFSERRKIVPDALKDLKGAEQFKENTSEFAIATAKLTGVSAIQIDYFMRQYFGYTAGLITMGVDELIRQSGMLDYERPERSLRDVITQIPGTTPFVVREFGNRATNDYYELKEQVEKIVGTFNKMNDPKYRMAYDRKAVAEYYKENEETIKYKRLIENKNAMLTKLRDRRKQVLAMPKNRMGGEEKKQQLDKTRKLERQYLSDIKDYRKQLYGQFLD
jgi:hypothetical protein